MKRLFTVMLFALVLTGFTISADAGVKKIRPDQLKVLNSNEYYEQSAERVRSLDGTNCSWTSAVKLPVGKRITKLKYYHVGYSGAHTSVELCRIKMGEARQSLAYFNWADTTGAMIPVEETNIDYPRIKSDYTYFIRVISTNSSSYIYGIKIVYQD